MAEKRALGRGLGALIPDKALEDKEKIATLKLSQITPSKFQPREDFDPDRLNDLISSIKEKGVIQPVLVRKKAEGDGYELIAGERRFRAASALGLDEMPAIIKQVNDTELLEISLIENIQRENLNPIEQAHAYERLCDEFSLTQDEIAKAVGKDRTTITNTLRLLTLPELVQEHIQKGEVSFGHAKALLSLGDSARQIELCKRIVREKLTVRQIENLVTKAPGVRKKKKLSKDPHIITIEEDLQRQLGTKVTITSGRKRGSIKIDFYSHDDLNRILNLLKIDL